MQCDLDLSKKPDWYFKLNPNATVPTLEFPDGRVVYESDLISELIEDLYPNQGAKLLPDDKVERALLKIDAQKLTKFIALYYSISFGGMNEEKGTKLNEEIKKIDTFLEGKKYLGGDTFNLLDILVYPHLSRVMFIKGSLMEEVFE